MLTNDAAVGVVLFMLGAVSISTSACLLTSTVTGPASTAMPLASIRYNVPDATPLLTSNGKFANSPPTALAAAKAGPAAAVDNVDANLPTSSAATQYSRGMSPPEGTAASAARKSLFGETEVIGVTPSSMRSRNLVST